MLHHTPTSSARRTGGILLSGLTAGALAIGGVVAPPPANATCASFFGIGNSADCRSNLFSVAIAIGTGAQAFADGLFGSAFAAGTNAKAWVNPSGKTGLFSFATAVGDQSLALVDGVFAIGTSVGPWSSSSTVAVPQAGYLGFNIALNLTPPNNAGYLSVLANGIGNVAVNLLGTGGLGSDVVQANGFANTGINIGGAHNTIQAGQPGTPGTFETAFNIFGSGNDVIAAPGPLGIAGSILQNGAAITKTGPGFNINGANVGPAAAVSSRKAVAAAATLSDATPKPSVAVGSSKRPTAKPAGAAAQRTRR